MQTLSVTVEEMARLLKISRPTAYKLVNSKDFPVLKIGRRKIIPYKQLEEWLEKNKSWELSCK